MLNEAFTQKPLNLQYIGWEGDKMDLIVTVVFASLLAIIICLIGIFTKKKIWRILLHTILGFIIGLPIGYFLAPIIISFF